MGSLEEYVVAAKLAELEQRQARSRLLAETGAAHAGSHHLSAKPRGMIAALRRPRRTPGGFVRRLSWIPGRSAGGSATTTSEPVLCALTEPDGTMLATARCWLQPGRGPREAVVAGFDRPGRIVSRCLLGQLRALVLQFPSGEVLHADLLQVSFDLRQGRTLVVRLTSPSGS